MLSVLAGQDTFQGCVAEQAATYQQTQHYQTSIRSLTTQHISSPNSYILALYTSVLQTNLHENLY
jgi:hypothetical protein